MGVNHYENFPVASWLLPAELRRPVATIYHFARTADDLADEGDFPARERLARLEVLRGQLHRIERAQPLEDPLFVALAGTIRRYGLPMGYFHDLLDAFSQDCTQHRYPDFAQLQAYAKRSANPVGRLLLHVFDAASEENLRHSDKICSALQYINFWQDVAIDYRKQRIYLPVDDMQAFDVSERDIACGMATRAFRELLHFQVARTRSMLHEGAALGRALNGRIGLEIRMIVAGGDTILQKIIDANYDVFEHRPVLRAMDWLHMLRRASSGDGRIAN